MKSQDMHRGGGYYADCQKCRDEKKIEVKVRMTESADPRYFIGKCVRCKTEYAEKKL